ncbi:DUF1501 domain-containing protein [Lacunimicrobium album]
MDMSYLRQVDPVSRRNMMKVAAQGILGVSFLSFSGSLTAAADPKGGKVKPGKAKQVIYFYLSGAMSHLDSFDPKPGTEVQGETKVIDTNLTGVKFSEYFPEMSKMADQLAIIRSMNTQTGDHEQARYLVRTSQKQIASIKHPTMASWVQKVKGQISPTLPPSVQIGGGGEGPGYLGAQYAPVPIAAPERGLENTKSPAYLAENQFDRRMMLSAAFDRQFKSKASKSTPIQNYDTLYEDAIKLLKSDELKAFDITQESQETRTRYGKSRFGQGALLAKRLIEHGVQFVEISGGNWDMHNDLNDRFAVSGPELDHAFTTLMADLKASGLLETTLVVIGTEFGRKPQINQNAGRDHHPAAFSCVLAGAGIKVGQVYGTTDDKGFYVEEDGVEPGGFNATIAATLGIPHDLEIISPEGRPFTIGNAEKAIEKLLA